MADFYDGLVERITEAAKTYMANPQDAASLGIRPVYEDGFCFIGTRSSPRTIPHHGLTPWLRAVAEARMPKGVEWCVLEPIMGEPKLVITSI